LVVNIKDLSDDRGSMFLFEYKNREFKLCEIKKGTARGGDIHKSADQYDLVLHGVIELREMLNNDERIKILKENDYAEINRGIPHILIAKKDSLIVEWRNGPFEREIYCPYRILCEEK